MGKKSETLNAETIGRYRPTHATFWLKDVEGGEDAIEETRARMAEILEVIVPIFTRKASPGAQYGLAIELSCFAMVNTLSLIPLDLRLGLAAYIVQQAMGSAEEAVGSLGQIDAMLAEREADNAET